MNVRIISGWRRAGWALVAAAGLVCGLLAVVTVVSRPAPAAAAPEGVTMRFRCEFPLIGAQDLDITIKTNMPKVAVVGERPVPRIIFDTVSMINDKTTNGLRTLDAATLSGTALARSAAVTPEYPNGVSVAPRAEIAKSSIPPAGAFKVPASGSTVGLAFEEPGAGRLVLRELVLFPILRKADGSPTDFEDGLEVPCARTSGSDLLAEFTIVAEDTQPPGTPGRPSVTAQTGTTASLKWGAASDDIGVSGYNVYDGTKKVLSTYGPDTTATLTGLTPESAHTFTVTARDFYGNESEPSDPVTVQLGPDVPERVPPTTPGDPSATHVGGIWVRLKWGASTDNVGVAFYDIYNGGKLAASFPGTGEPEGWVEGLQPLTSYTFAVRARDAAGNVSPFSRPVTVRTLKGAPQGCGEYPDAPADLASRGCVYMSGFNNVQKLDGAAIVNDPRQGPAFANVAFKTVEQKYVKARFRFTRPLRSTTTFLTFGFMPTTATMELTQIGDGSLEGEYKGDGYDIKASATMRVRIYDATANGAPVNVGARCQTGTPMKIGLTASPADYKDILEGGVLKGTTAIPAFAGCGVGEDLDPLFTGAVSGSGNLIKIKQGPICKKETAECLPVDPVR
ncbi:fibronectin type III domain-containing protein [Spirillospora sp. NPDC047279]|uniref:fibronectin type III domain-containing protein n=1 Tax=Spirillospora sp. NPDC047279 TaxID=3155478 RepID=UPI0033C1C328